MRITPSLFRLRNIAIICWLVAGLGLIQTNFNLLANHSLLLVVAICIGSILFLALGIAFWLLGTDRRANIAFDSKGLMLNLGHSASFVSWANIESVGVGKSRFSLLSLGSRKQLGINLRHADEYIQSYETRIPASKSIFARALRLLKHSLNRSEAAAPTTSKLEALRRFSGYDILIPEALLGGNVEETVEIIEAYRNNPYQRRDLQIRAIVQQI